VPAHRDPLERLRRHLDREKQWTPTFQDVIEAEVRASSSARSPRPAAADKETP
jgi:TPP-dependent pyruvate/acetoin dehydrogenase alpha subunit